MCFEQLDESLPQRVEDEVRRAVNFWLPYVNIVEVETLTQEDNKSKIFVRVKFSTTLNSDTLQQIELDAVAAEKQKLIDEMNELKGVKTEKTNSPK